MHIECDCEACKIKRKIQGFSKNECDCDACEIRREIRRFNDKE